MHRGTRWSVAACGLALTMFVGACSGGSSRVSSNTRAPSSSDASGGSSDVTSDPSSTDSTGATSSTTGKKKDPTVAVRNANGAVVLLPQSQVPTGAIPADPSSSTPTIAGVVDSGSSTPTTRGTNPTGGSNVTTTVPKTTTTVYTGPRPYDPTKPIDLGGEPGVSPAEQARAEQLVRDTLKDLKKYATTDAAYAAGFRTIGDSATGDEHYINWAYVQDTHIVDPQYPESLVYEWRNGVHTLVAAMYMLPIGFTFNDVPDIGGALTQWHIHNNLCLTDLGGNPDQKVVTGLTPCSPPATQAAVSPMLHVWIVSNPCGPFAALEGIGAGQVPPGQTRLCDTGHGAP